MKCEYCEQKYNIMAEEDASKIKLCGIFYRGKGLIYSEAKVHVYLFVCTRQKGHDGVHVACGAVSHIIVKWSDDHEGHELHK